ncbi:hypothetical protein CcCBS67573_g02876 [Chytriomyces confervae]|uniref:WW domain-containing protein n=1 Tax=Chytriomyces confervae TaxID=246404 RepID=A0A507FJP5_9FUNG|nr:hypothetical protein CcCBS67573_g02876 [Chytriomyces confervae]
MQAPPPPPPPLPPGFSAQWSAQYNRYFFVNTSTGQSQWDLPQQQPMYQPPQQYPQQQQQPQQPQTKGNPLQQLSTNPMAAVQGFLGGSMAASLLGQSKPNQGHPQQGYQQQPQYQQGPPQQSHYPNQQQSGSYVATQNTTLVLKESFGSFSGDDMTISDQTGRAWFRLDAQTLSMRDKRTLLDANTNMPVVRLEKKLFSIGTKWQATGPSGAVLFTIEPKLLTLTPAINVFLADGDRNPDFKITGSFMQKDFELFDIRNGGKRPVGVCKKERATANLGAFLSTMVFKKDSYFLTLYPGADVSMWVAICVLLDELYNDEK